MLQRVAVLAVGLMLMAIGGQSWIGVIRALNSATADTELAGLGMIVSLTFLLMGSGLVIRALFRLGSARTLPSYALITIGVSWLVGVLTNALITTLRLGPTGAETALDRVIDVVSWVRVTVLFALPSVFLIMWGRRV